MRIKKHSSSMPTTLVLLAVCFIGAAQAQDILYQLEPGSTITPWSVGGASGPAEPLTGSFTLQPASQFPDVVFMNVTALSLQSSTFSLTLDPANTGGPWFQSVTNGSYFIATVDCPQLSNKPLQMSTTPSSPSPYGSFTGPATSPATVSYLDLFLSASGNSPELAQISFQAQLVPEPGAAILVLLGLAALKSSRARGSGQGD